MAKIKFPLAVRNKNPLNIRHSKGDLWQGLVSAKSGFCVFSSFVYGYRAAFRLLHTYNTKYHLVTIRDIIKRWAPESENNTIGYIKRVCELIGCVDTFIIDVDDIEDREYAISLVQAMASVESGVPYDRIARETISAAWEVAFMGASEKVFTAHGFYRSDEERRNKC